MALTPKQVNELHDKMLHKRLYVIFSEPTEKTGNRRKVFPKHIAYQLEIERKGILFAAGPFVNSKGVPNNARQELIMQLSKHFTLEEFEKSQTATRKGITNKAGRGEIKNLGDLCYEVLEPVRAKFDKPVTIT